MKIYYLILINLYLVYCYNINTYYINKNINLNADIKKNNNINFFIWKGSSVPSKNYIEFSKGIIKKGLKHNLNINITICNNYKIPELNNSILFGHSSGGYHSLKYDKSNLMAKITYGSLAKKEYENTIFEINNDINTKTLHIVGEYDGYVSYVTLLNNNKNNNKFICSRTNHLCIVENKKSLISTLLCMYDNKLKEDYKTMMNEVINIVVSYILHLNNSSVKIYNTKYTKNILKSNNIYEIEGYRHFLRTKPDICKSYMYIDNRRGNTYIKTCELFGDMLLDLLIYKYNKKFKIAKTSLEWLINNDNEIVLFIYEKKNFTYFKLPYIIK